MKSKRNLIEICLLGVVLLPALSSGAQNLTFHSSTYPVGSGPVMPAVADLNGDGKLDLIIPIAVFTCADPAHNSSGNTLMVLTNNGSGGFGVNATLFDPLVGFVADAFAVGDFNGDGYVDLICGTSGPGCSGGDNYLIVFTNNGSGDFGYNTTLLAGNKTNPVAADLNGDGQLDLIVANFLDGTVTVLMNTSVFPPSSLTPKLTINLEAKDVRVAWPSVSPGWSLQQNTDLRTPNWLPSGYDGYGIADDGTNKSITMPPAHGDLFFRLLHP